MVCKCGGKEFFTEEHGNQTGLYCSACGKWQKWLKKDEIRLSHQRTSNTKMLTYSSIAEAAHDFWVKRKCGKDYRIVVLKSVEVKRVIDYYESKNFI